MSSPGHVTQLLQRYDSCDTDVFDQLLPLVYEELRHIAHRVLSRERRSHTLGTTALVHECYLKLVNQDEASYNDQIHFMAVAARAMRQILVDYARRRNTQKRGGERHTVPLDPELAFEKPSVDMIALDTALNRLFDNHERMAQVVECRFFGNMTVQETADALGTSPRTVHRDWSRARAYLHEALHDPV